MAITSTPDLTNEQFKETSKERRIKDVGAARTLYESYSYDNTQRYRQYALVRGQMEGARPYEEAALADLGMANMTNVNFGDSQAARDRTLLPYWRAVHNAPHAASFAIDSGSPDTDKWQVALAECFDLFLADWGASYFVQYMRMAKNFVDFGPGMVFWGNKESPRFKAINVQRVLFPKNCSMDQDEWECVIIEREMAGTELYKHIRNKKAERNAEYVGWNAEAIKAALVWAKENKTWDGRDWTRYQDQLVNNDVALTSKYQPLTVIDVFLKQFDGKIGRYTFTKQETSSKFLCEIDDYADDFKSIIGTVWYDTGSDAMVHSIKGFGVKNYHFGVLTNRMKSKMCDGASLAMSLNLIRPNDMPEETPPIEQYGFVNLFPAGMQQFQTYPQFTQGLGILQMLEQNQASNNALYREQQQQIRTTETATQAKILAAQQGDVTESSMAIYLAQVGENLFEQCFERLRKSSGDADAKKFRKRAMDKGVPKEILNDGDIRVTTGASAGLSNPAVRAMIFQEMLALANAPGMNSRWIYENLIANKLGSRAVKYAMLPEGADSSPLQRRQAIMENSEFGQGIPLPVAPSDAHVEHIDEHLKPLDAIAQEFNQTGGQINQERIPAMMVTLEHAAQHFAFLEGDETKKGAYKQLWPRFSQIQSIARGILTQLQKQQQMQQMAMQQGGQPALAAG